MRKVGPGLRGASFEVVAIVAAAGKGRRAATATPKQFVRAGGVSLLERAIATLGSHPEISAVVAVVPAERVRSVQAMRRRHPKLLAVVAGGARRQDSVARGLATECCRRCEVVLVHDAARPLVPAGVVTRVIRAAKRSGAAVPGLVPSDTVKKVGRGGRVEETLDRDNLRLIQTPQGFRRAWLDKAYSMGVRRRLAVTDDAAMVESAGFPVIVVEGSAEAFKVTTREDLDRLRSRLDRRGR